MRIMLVDDHAMMRDGLRAILANEEDMEVVGEATDAAGAVVQVVALSPDIVLMDISLPGLNGVEATRRVLAALPTVKVIALSMHNNHHYVRAMFEAGAVGYVPKNAASEELLQAIRAVAHSGSYVSPTITQDVVARLIRGGQSPATLVTSELSKREREVLQFLADGKTSKEIAVEMSVAVSTIETYRRQIMIKLDLHSVAQLTKYAIWSGLTTID